LSWGKNAGRGISGVYEILKGRFHVGERIN
jgi:hypothetical protein